MSPSSKEPLLEKGTVLNGKWEIIDHIATGGMAEVYRAQQLNLDREVAVKILSPEFLASFEGDEEEIQSALGRFQREVKAMAQVRHPNVLQVYDQDRAVLQINGRELTIEYIAMEYIPGPNLRSAMPPEGLRDNEKGAREWIGRYFLPILDGIETVHALGIVHRDLKPHNVVLDGFTPKIMDFGLAGGRQWRGLTQDHHMYGTMQYMAPEQLMDLGETDARGDIYSLGKILYEAISGEMTKETAFPLKTARLADPGTPFLRRMDRIIQQATDEDRKQRIPSVAVLREALVEILERADRSAFRLDKPVEGFRIWRARPFIGALVLIAAASIGFHVLYHRERPRLPAQPEPLSLSDSARSQISRQEETVPSPVAPAVSPTPTPQGRDGATLRLVSGGEFVFPENFGRQAKKTVKVNPFYMDETEVTNHQYVEFLNRVLPGLAVENGVVRADGDIWLLLGAVRAGYEPIVFRDGRFHAKDPALASHPVVRVTGYGAAAYANFYGRRLPTEAEWLYAVMGGGKTPEGSRGTAPGPAEQMGVETGGGQMMHGHMMHSPAPVQQIQREVPLPVIQSQPNAYGLRGLDRNVREWGQRSEGILPQQKERLEYVIFMGGFGLGSSSEPELTPPVSRQPWEAFEDVGFRCALSVPKQRSKRDGS